MKYYESNTSCITDQLFHNIVEIVENLHDDKHFDDKLR